jgi:macrolide transport system ATP-binding/permease protein
MSSFRDVAYSLRALRKNPWFTLTALLSLTVGIGAATTVFAVVNAFLIRPLPCIREPQRLLNVRVREKGDVNFQNFSLPSLGDLQQSDTALSGLASFSDHALSMTRHGESELVRGQIVSANYFDVLGVKPLYGRYFAPGEDSMGNEHPVAVVNFTFWQTRLGGDPHLVGSQITINGAPLTVIGIAPRGFGGTFVGFVDDFWVPNDMAPRLLQRRNLAQRKTRWLEAIGRLRPGTSLQQAQAGMSTVQRRLAQDFPEERNMEIALSPVTGFDLELRGGVIVFLAIIMAVSLLVLLISSMNVTNMVLARGVARSKEIATRLALGIDRGRLIRQLLMENVILALLGGLAGTLAARWGVELLRQMNPPTGIRLVFDFSLDAGVLAFAFLVSVLSGLAFGLLPALQASRTDLVTSLKEVAVQASGRARLRSLLVVGQVAASTLLLITAALFLRALQHAGSQQPGFDPRGVETVTLDPSVLGYDEVKSRDFFLRLEERLAALPGVEAASLSNKTPLGFGSLFGGTRTAIDVEGRQPPPGVDGFKVEFTVIGPRYLDVLRIPLLRGRDLSPADREQMPRVAIVNEAMARHFWPGQDPVGKRFRHDRRLVEIVGLAKDSKYVRLNETPRDHLYLAFAQLPSPRMTLFLRTARSPSSLAAPIREEIRRTAPNLPVLNLMTMDESMAIARLPQRVAASVATTLGFSGLLLATVGIYGVVAYSVSQRRREIGLRMALGADRQAVIRLVVRQGVALAAAGVFAGALGALAVGRLLSGLLFGISPADPLTFSSIAVLLLVTAAMASLLPAQGAARIDPMAALGSG